MYSTKATKIIKAIGVTHPNKDGIIGYVMFTEDASKNTVKIEAEFHNVKPGKHGFHIHDKGNLLEGCKSLCDHFNPSNEIHGGRNSLHRHVGDLGNLIANKNGIIKSKFYDDQIKLRGKNNIIGRSFVLHQDVDDLGKGGNKESLITGNSGTRIACGVIGYA